MKFKSDLHSADGGLSHLVRGAWIEMPVDEPVEKPDKSHLVRGAWIEIRYRRTGYMPHPSHLVRGAWIEITP